MRQSQVVVELLHTLLHSTNLRKYECCGGTPVHHQQIFVDDYDDLSKLEKVLDPKGGGSTCAECVPKYMKENAIKPQCVIMLTDGYLDQLVGRFNVPTLWVVTHSKTYVPTEGRVVQFEDY